jgi:hypothetical protein
MWWTRSQVEQPAQLCALKVASLEDNAARAGAALGCSYSSSAEYEAELIAVRRAAGVYGPRRKPWRMRLAAVAVGLAVVVAVIVLIS